ncbi:zinc-ribbon domain-containing protein, partial [Myxococcota bacterium]
PSTSLATLHPLIAEDWHPILNGDLTPDTVHGRSDRKVWWRCPINPEHVWRQRVADRVSGSGLCPLCFGRNSRARWR